MSELKVNRVLSIDGTSTVEFATGVSGNAEGLRFDPKILTHNPPVFDTGVSRNLSQISLTFDQEIQFSGVGTIYIREGSPTGTIYEQFTCGVSAGATISGETLVLNLSAGQLSGTTNYYVTLPSVGIANTYTQYYKGSESYLFQTADAPFDIQGGDYEQILVDGTSPTGFYKYNIFITSGIATFSAPSATATNFTYVLVGGGGGGSSGNASPTVSGGSAAGGGGGAGGVVKNVNSNAFQAGNLTVTIGAGGNGNFIPPGATPPFTYTTSPGNDSSIGPTPIGTLTAFGGGGAGRNFFQGPVPSGSSNYPLDTIPAERAGRPGGSGGGATINYPTSPLGADPNGIEGGSAIGYPGPTQQGYPGGKTVINPAPGNVSYCGGGGGGGSGAGQEGPLVPAPTSPLQYYIPSTSGQGGAARPNPEFVQSIMSSISGFPSQIYLTMGTSGQLAGGGGGEVYAAQFVAPGTPTVPTNFTPSDAGQGGRGNTSSGKGGGGDGRYYTPGPPSPFAVDVRLATAGVNGTGGGGGGGWAGNKTNLPTPISDPQPTSWNWHGTPGGSGCFMVRYAHPGS